MSRYHRGTVALKPENSLKRAEELIGVRFYDIIPGFDLMVEGFVPPAALSGLGPSPHAGSSLPRLASRHRPRVLRHRLQSHVIALSNVIL